ncbi:MAG: FAD-dependent oxidoreductase [Patescibacteria group bacterium]
MYDLIIIGAGPAGIAAGIYAARKKLKTLIISADIGGQPVIASKINNFIGFKSLSGVELKKALEEHLRSYEGIELKEGQKVSKIEKNGERFSITAENEEIFETKTVLLAMGSRPRKLNVPGESKFEGRGVFYCSICDAPLMKNKIAAVVGGGNSGFYAVLDLISYASKIYVLEYSDSFKADPIYIDKAKESGRVEFITMAAAQEITGDGFVKNLKYQKRDTGENKEIDLDGVFVAVGYQPNNPLVKDLVKINNNGRVIINHQTQETSIPGIWAAGDVTDVLYNQINIAIGDAITAVLNIYDYLNER